MSCSTNAARQPSGSCASARSRSIFVTVCSARPAAARVGQPGSSSSASVTWFVRAARLRRWSRHRFVASRYSHVPSADSPRKLSSFRCAARKISCSRSSASAGLPASGRHAEQPAGVRPVQLFEGGQVPCAAPLDQRHVLGPAGESAGRGWAAVTLDVDMRCPRCRHYVARRTASRSRTYRARCVPGARLFRAILVRVRPAALRRADGQRRFAEVADSSAGPHETPFGPQQRPLQLEVAAVAAEPPGGGDDAVARARRGAPHVAHDVADGARRPRAAGAAAATSP